MEHPKKIVAVPLDPIEALRAIRHDRALRAFWSFYVVVVATCWYFR